MISFPYLVINFAFFENKINRFFILSWTYCVCIHSLHVAPYIHMPQIHIRMSSTHETADDYRRIHWNNNEQKKLNDQSKQTRRAAHNAALSPIANIHTHTGRYFVYRNCTSHTIYRSKQIKSNNHRLIQTDECAHTPIMRARNEGNLWRLKHWRQTFFCRDDRMEWLLYIIYD